jgi:hypothetical protein
LVDGVHGTTWKVPSEQLAHAEHARSANELHNADKNVPLEHAPEQGAHTRLLVDVHAARSKNPGLQGALHIWQRVLLVAEQGAI